jgi:hypothetical protein
MTERTLPGLGLRAFYAPGQRDWGTTVSEDLRRLSALVQPRALSRTTALPAVGNAGDIYLVPTGAAAQANALALWDGAAGAEAWVYLPPQLGWIVYIADEDREVRFTATGWSALPKHGVVTLRAIAAASYTLELGDLGCLIETTAATPQTLLLPSEATVAFEIGAMVHVTQAGTGAATIIATSDVTLNGITAGSVTLDGRWAGVALVKRGADAWVIQGALAGAVA